MRNLDNFRQAVESPKSLNLMGYIFPKKTFLQLKHYIQRIDLTLLSTACVKIYQTPYIMFETTSQFFFKLFITLQCEEKLFCTFLAETVHDLDKRSPSKCKTSDFPLLM